MVKLGVNSKIHQMLSLMACIICSTIPLIYYYEKILRFELYNPEWELLYIIVAPAILLAIGFVNEIAAFITTCVLLLVCSILLSAGIFSSIGIASKSQEIDFLFLLPISIACGILFSIIVVLRHHTKRKLFQVLGVSVGTVVCAILLITIFGFALKYFGAKAGAFLFVLNISSVYKVFKGLERKILPNSEELLKIDNRPFVILLRSFCSDNTTVEAPFQIAPFQLKSIREVRISYEEIITRQLKSIGPVIAIGQPGESFPPHGAARKYMNNSEWQESLTDLIEKSGLVALIAGTTDGVLWELKQICNLGKSEKFMLIIPPPSVESESGSKNNFIWENFVQKVRLSGLNINLPTPEEVKNRKIKYISFNKKWEWIEIPSINNKTDFSPEVKVKNPKPSLIFFIALLIIGFSELASAAYMFHVQDEKTALIMAAHERKLQEIKAILVGEWAIRNITTPKININLKDSEGIIWFTESKMSIKFLDAFDGDKNYSVSENSVDVTSSEGSFSFQLAIKSSKEVKLSSDEVSFKIVKISK